MDHGPKNHHRIAGVVLFAVSLVAGLMVAGGSALADNGSRIYEQAWACSTLYSRSPIKVLNGGDRETATCLGEGRPGRAPMTRAEAWELCREQFDTTTLLLAWTGRGWHCRFYSH